MKGTLLTSLILILSATNIVAPQRQEIQYQSMKGDETIMSDNVAIFDLSTLDESESISITNESGGKAIITLEKYNGPDAQQITKALPNNTYTISYNSLTEKISYKITIRNNLITSIFAGSYSVFGYSVNSSSLNLNSSKSASYILNCSFVLRSWTNSLNSRITGTNELEIRFNG